VSANQIRIPKIIVLAPADLHPVLSITFQVNIFIATAITLKGLNEMPWVSMPKGKCWRTDRRCKVVVAPLQVFFDGELLPGGFAPLYPGLSHFTSSGVKTRIDYSRFFLLVIFADAQRQIQTYQPKAQAKDS
jgi:hypothetical protein